MSPRPGTASVVTFGSAALGGAPGRSLPIGNGSSAILLSVSLLYTGSATAGNRVPVLRVLDANGNLLWTVANGTSITAGQTVRFMAGAGVTAGQVTAAGQFSPLPMEFTIPGGASLQILDSANIDAADTVSGTATLVL